MKDSRPSLMTAAVVACTALYGAQAEDAASLILRHCSLQQGICAAPRCGDGRVAAALADGSDINLLDFA